MVAGIGKLINSRICSSIDEVKLNGFRFFKETLEIPNPIQEFSLPMRTADFFLPSKRLICVRETQPKEYSYGSSQKH